MSVSVSKIKHLHPHAYIPEIPIQHLHISVDYFQRHQLIVALRDAAYKEQRCISTIDDLGIYECNPRVSSQILLLISEANATFVLQEVAHAGSTSKHELCNILNDLRLGFGRHRCEPFGETDFTYGVQYVRPSTKSCPRSYLAVIPEEYS